jgi:transcriptional regulator with XRE-family HTH domain
MIFKIILCGLVFRETEWVLELTALFGLRLEELRRTLGLTRDELASRTGIDVRRIASYELEGAWPDPKTVSKLALGLEVGVHDVFDFTDTRVCPKLTLERRLEMRRRRARASRHG